MGAATLLPLLPMVSLLLLVLQHLMVSLPPLVLLLLPLLMSLVLSPLRFRHRLCLRPGAAPLGCGGWLERCLLVRTAMLTPPPLHTRLPPGPLT